MTCQIERERERGPGGRFGGYKPGYAGKAKKPKKRSKTPIPSTSTSTETPQAKGLATTPVTTPEAANSEERVNAIVKQLVPILPKTVEKPKQTTT